MALYDNQKLYQAVKELQIISQSQLDQAFKDSQTQKISLADILVSKDLISSQNLGKLLSELTSIPFINLSQQPIPNDILTIVPEVVAKKQQIIAFKKDAQGLHLAMVDPSNKQIQEFITKKTGLPIVVYITTKNAINDALAHYSQDVAKAFDEIIKENIQQAKGAAKTEPPIIKIVDTILNYAYQNKASDIHIEPLKESSLVRFRVDGILHDIVKLPLDLHPRILTRVKVLAKLRTDEHQSAQDGKISYKTDNEDLDIRVSIVPITEGEKTVMRLLSARSRQFGLADLGFSPTSLKKVQQAYSKPDGMILSTGPTGSGKTTTLYAILKLLNKREINITTIEDPVEYDMDNINQIQVNLKTELTFAKGLRSIVRQDPDIILVGEIRDEETADIAINSAMTGHLVLSTLHTNDAATAIPRLLDMGVEPFLVASTVNVIIAQRLVRKIHSSCRVSQEVPIADLSKQLGETLTKQFFADKQTVRLYHGKGCQMDHNTGYENRIGIFEVLIIDDEIREAITSKKDAATIHKIAVKNGMITMFADGITKAKQGLTSIQEIIRVTKE